MFCITFISYIVLCVSFSKVGRIALNIIAASDVGIM